MLIILENNKYMMVVDTKGAEIRSLKTKEGKELFWQRTLDADGEKIWGSTATNCFPLTGPAQILNEEGSVLKNGAYRLGDVVYELGQHGFVRDTETEFVKPDATKKRFALGSEVKLKISSSEETKKVYPFDFDYVVHYKLSEAGDKGLVSKTISITNTGDRDMPFNIGDHEGFALDDDITKYYLMFNSVETVNAERAGKPVIETKNGKSIVNLNREMFMVSATGKNYDMHGNKVKGGGYTEKAIQFSGSLNSKYATLVKRGENGEPDKAMVTLTLNSPKFLLWSRPPFKFVCPEPWHGEPTRAREGEEAKFYNSLKPGETYTLSRVIYAHSEPNVKKETGFTV